MRISPQAAFRALRQRAEQRRLAAAPVGAAPEVQRLLQELHLSQLKLESQYQQLLQVQTTPERDETRYAELYDAAPLGYCTLDLAGVVRQLNLSACRLLGAGRAELLKQPLARFVAPAEQGRLAVFLAQLLATPSQRHSCELTMHRADEQPFFAQLEGVASVVWPARPATYHLIVLDVSARHRAAEALARFQAAFEQSPEGMALLEDQRFVAANNALLRLLGCTSSAQLLGHALAEYWPERQPGGTRTRTLLAACLAQAHAQGYCRLELLHHGPTGAPQWAELSLHPLALAGPPLLHLTWRDITARKRQEQQLRDSEAGLQQALAAAGTGVWSWHLASDRLAHDARAQEIFNLTSGVPFTLLQTAVHPADAGRLAHTLAHARRTRTAFDLELRLLRPDGCVRHVATSGRFSYDEATGRPQALQGLVRDVTPRREVEEELSYKNRLLDTIVHNMPLVLIRLDAAGCVREHVGQPLLRLGLADNELAGRPFEEAFPDSVPHFRQVLAGQPVSYVASVRRNGQLTYLQVAGYFDQERQEAVLFGVDVTDSERLKAEASRAQLRQQQELHAVILTTQEEERRRIAEGLHNGVGQLLYATRLHLDTLPPSQPLAQSQQLLNEAIRATRTISFELTPTVLEGFGLPVALRELVRRIPGSLTVDLYLHNLDAPLETTLSTATYRMVQELLNNVMKHARAREVFVSVAREAQQLHISVEDDGVGFDPGHSGSGPGIGLVGIRTRVGLLGGSFEVKSRPGRGTGFFLQLPVRAATPASEPGRP